MSPWDFAHRLNNSNEVVADYPIQSGLFDESTQAFFANEKEHPYLQEKPFHWIRGYQVGGRSITWGRQCYRLSDLDFEANAKDGAAIDWPIRYKDIAPWYDYVETFAGISGQAEGIPHLPDGQFLPAMEMNVLEKHFKAQITKKYPERFVTIGRTANLTRGWEGRGPCQYRNLCMRGCPFGGYFSSNAATLPAAAATGNLTMRPNAIVSEILYDAKTGKATGVRIIDSDTKKTHEYFARIIFLNASTIASTAILLRSTSEAFPDGLGNSSQTVGKYLMDHHFRVGAEAAYDGFKDRYYKGRRPNGIYIPRFRNLGDEATKRNDYLRGFGYQGDAERQGWKDKAPHISGFGVQFKEALSTPGDWTMWLGAWGETLPQATNSVTLDDNKKDQWGLSLVKIDFEFGDNEKAMRKDMQASAAEMMETAGLKNIKPFDYASPGGTCVHEMGTIRMGKDKLTAPLNEWNQLHDVPNVFITDGACMTSSACQNPSLTYMALTARACDYATRMVKEGKL
jgi:choline dehydrogenase-like flavoprotein